MDLSYFILIISTILSCVSFLFVLKYNRLKDKPLVIILLMVSLSQLFWEQLPDYVYDINFILLISYVLQKKFNFCENGCSRCEFKKGMKNGKF